MPNAQTVEPVETASPYLLTREVAARYRRSVRSIRELTRRDRIPHFKTPGSQVCLFPLDQLEQWEAGVELETIVLPDAKIVRPVPTPDTREPGSPGLEGSRDDDARTG